MEGETPAYIKDRLALYEKFKAKYDAEIASKYYKYWIYINIRKIIWKHLRLIWMLYHQS